MSDPATAPTDAAKEAPSPRQAPVADGSRSSLLHMVVLYPTLAVALINAAPTLFEKFQAWQKGVQQQELYPALERNRLITKNMDCMMAPINWVDTTADVRVDATICHKTGDILVRMTWASNRQFMDVVSSDAIRARADKEGGTAQAGPLGGWISTAVASVPQPQELQQPQIEQAEQVICQRWIREGRLLQRVKTQAGACFDQVLDTFRGLVESRQPAPCNPQC
jgi:hypothetical protein